MASTSPSSPTMTAPTEKADPDGGLQPGELDRPVQEALIRAARPEQVAQQDDLVDPAHFGESHGGLGLGAIGIGAEAAIGAGEASRRGG